MKIPIKSIFRDEEKENPFDHPFVHIICTVKYTDSIHFDTEEYNNTFTHLIQMNNEDKDNNKSILKDDWTWKNFNDGLSSFLMDLRETCLKAQMENKNNGVKK